MAGGMNSVEVGNAGKFDPRSFNATARRTFHDLKIGEVYRLPSRSVTEAQFAAFQVVSGDYHPIHYDVAFCRAYGLPGMLAHRLQVLCFTAIGAGSFPHEIGDVLIGFIE